MSDPVLWIRIGFNADPDPAFNKCGSEPVRIHADLDPDPDLGPIVKSQKCNFLMKKIPKVGNRPKNITTKVQKPF